MQDQLLTVADLARMFQVSKQAVYDMRYRGDLPPAVRIGRQNLRWRPTDIQAWLEAQSTDTTSRPRVRCSKPEHVADHLRQTVSSRPRMFWETAACPTRNAPSLRHRARLRDSRPPSKMRRH
jgi:predicted DNA-binding transcriptional regulator AlpA